MQIDLLVRMFSKVVTGHIARDHDHRDAIQSGVCNTGGGIRQSGAQMGQYDRGLTRDPRVAICRMGGNLLVSCIDECNGAARQSREYRNIGMATQAENMPDTASLQISNQFLCYGRSHVSQCLRVVELTEQLRIGRPVLGYRAADPGSL